MKEAIIASAVAAGLLSVFGLEGCGSGATLWKLPEPPPLCTPASRSGAGALRRSDSSPSPERLTEEDRAELSRLIDKLN